MSIVETKNLKNLTFIIFLPIEINNFDKIFFHGDFELSDNAINLYVSHTCQKACERCIGSCMLSNIEEDERIIESSSLIHLERCGRELLLKKLKFRGEFLACEKHESVVIYYNRETFIKSRNSLLYQEKNYANIKSQFRKLIEKLDTLEEENNCEIFFDILKNLVNLFRFFVLWLSCAYKLIFRVTKYSNIGVHINNHLSGFRWILDPDKTSDKDGIKKLNFLLSFIVDLTCGSLFLNWLTCQFSPESFPEFFLLTADVVVDSLRDIIHWLTGDPAGFKLNVTYSKILATFFLFYIDIWCVFIALLKPAYKVIFQIFVVLGKLGFTFQISIIADLLLLVSFHISSIFLYAARLYNIQLYALLALWRLFLGRKKNPLRGRVDSCKYSPEQLFIGTLGFTVLLFLLPTTLIYYIVFTSMKVLTMTIGGILNRIHHIVYSLPIYSTILWIFGSPKMNGRIELNQFEIPFRNKCLIFYAKPVSISWYETIAYYKPDVIEKPNEFKILNFIYLLVNGKLK